MTVTQRLSRRCGFDGGRDDPSQTNWRNYRHDSNGEKAVQEIVRLKATNPTYAADPNAALRVAVVGGGSPRVTNLILTQPA